MKTRPTYEFYLVVMGSAFFASVRSRRKEPLSVLSPSSLDPWLTQKSTLCPICKWDCLPSERHEQQMQEIGGNAGSSAQSSDHRHETLHSENQQSEESNVAEAPAEAAPIPPWTEETAAPSSTEPSSSTPSNQAHRTSPSPPPSSSNPAPH